MATNRLTEESSETARRLKASRVYAPFEQGSLKCVIFHPKYDIKFFGIEKCHPFDACKWGRVYKRLVEMGTIKPNDYLKPVEASREDLLIVHSRKYLSSLNWSAAIALIMEVPCVACFPSCLIHRMVMNRFRLHVGGTILAARVALELGTAVNIGGGFHHCSSKSGGGFCPYADITLALRFLFLQQLISKAMIVDLDAHQGNGHERDFLDDQRVYILDMYNAGIYPFDNVAKAAIRKSVELDFFVESKEYLKLLHTALIEAIGEFKPDIVLYNAGTDCLNGDPLGALCLSPMGVIKRDEIVFNTFRNHLKHPTPVVMVTSGGYQRSNANVIADSLTNLFNKGYFKNQPNPFKK